MAERELKGLVSETLKRLEERMEKNLQNFGKESIEQNEPKCLICNDEGFIRVKIEGEEERYCPITPCQCAIKKRKEATIKRYTPEIWIGLSVNELQPWGVIDEIFSVESQGKIIRELQQNPLSGHSFFGCTGTGKSRFLHCLLQEAVNAGKNVFFSKMSNLITGIRDEEFGRLPQERWGEIIDTEDLRRRKEKNKLHIFIDEIDKIPRTDDVYLKFFELIDFIYEHKECAELSVCSNLSLVEFSVEWGTALARRISDVSDCHILGPADSNAEGSE